MKMMLKSLKKDPASLTAFVVGMRAKGPSF